MRKQTGFTFSMTKQNPNDKENVISVLDYWFSDNGNNFSATESTTAFLRAA
jgi:hypothetical protein